MNYIELIKKFWQCNNEYPAGCNATALYFYLLERCNSLGWKDTFKHSDRFISAQLGISINTVRSSKNKLKQLGLIDFKAPAKASRGIDGITTYSFKTLSKYDSVVDTVVDSVPDTVTCIVPDTITKLNKTKQREDIPPNPQMGESEISTSEVLDSTPKEKERKGKTRGAEFDLSFVDVVYIGIVKDFIEYRKQIKKPYKTVRGVEMFYSELLKLSNNNLQKAKQLVDYAKGKEWQTVYEIKDNGTNQRAGATAKERDLESLARNIEQGIIRGSQRRNQHL